MVQYGVSGLMVTLGQMKKTGTRVFWYILILHKGNNSQSSYSIFLILSSLIQISWLYVLHTHAP